MKGIHARHYLLRIVRLAAGMCAGAVSLIAYCAVTTVVSAHTTAVPVVRCPTEFGAMGPSPRTLATLTVISSLPTRGLVAYTNTESYLLAPTGMRCSGIAAADGGSQVIVWPHGHGRPGFHSVAWVSLPYMPPEEYAGWTGPGRG